MPNHDKPRTSTEMNSLDLDRAFERFAAAEDFTVGVEEEFSILDRETLELVRAYYKIRENRVRKRIFEMVKAVGAASHAEVLGGRKGR